MITKSLSKVYTNRSVQAIHPEHDPRLEKHNGTGAGTSPASVSTRPRTARAVESFRNLHRKLSVARAAAAASDNSVHHHLPSTASPERFSQDYQPNTTNYNAAAKPKSHRSYVSFNPTCNKLLAKKWDDNNRRLHLEKLKRIKPTVDNSPPKVYKHLEVNIRKIQIEEARLAEIERNNTVLVEKMADIMRTTATEHDYTKGNEPEPEYLQMLHMARRQRELDTINRQNLAMLLRLENRDSTYSSSQWAKERNRNLYYLRNISSFPQKYIAEAEKLNSNGLVPQPRPVSAHGSEFTRDGELGEKRRDKLPLISQKRSDTLSSLDSMDPTARSGISRDDPDTPERPEPVAAKLGPGDGDMEKLVEKQHEVRKATTTDMAPDRPLHANNQRRSSQESIQSFERPGKTTYVNKKGNPNRGNEGKKNAVAAKELDRRNKQETSGRHERD